jgi:two-component system heavy metal sensor histidine kinase CusS
MPESSRAVQRSTVRRARSITCRLVCGYALVSLVMLSLAAVLLHRGLRRGFEIEDGELLSDRIADVRRAVERSPGNLTAAQEEILQLAGERDIEKFYGRLLDASGKVLVETPGAAEVMPPPSECPRPEGLEDKADEVVYVKSPNGNPAWLVAAQIAQGGQGPAMVYQVALDTRHVEKWLGDFSQKLILVVAGATMVTGLLGWEIARRSLRPLADITAAAQRITASGLNDSIGEKPWPRELVSLAVEFDGMLERLRNSFERLSQFTADAAHEFRTPLNNLLGATSLALARPRSSEEYRTLLEANLEEYQRLSHMMERLLFLARADNAQMVVNPQVLDAGGVLREVAEFFSALAEDRGVVLHCEGTGTLTADPALLRMALTNLVSNALRHAPAGSAVSLTAAPRNGGVCITVADEGEGIAEEHLPRLFDRFYRAEASRAATGGHSGAGLGLALVKTIMEIHGGTVTVESGAGKGAVFRLEFPAAVKR